MAPRRSQYWQLFFRFGGHMPSTSSSKDRHACRGTDNVVPLPPVSPTDLLLTRLEKVRPRGPLNPVVPFTRRTRRRRSPAELLLSRLWNVRKQGPDYWLATCPAPTSKAHVLAIRQTPDRALLLKCLGEHGAVDVIRATGMHPSALYSAATHDSSTPHFRKNP
jgi:hypothetical protein